MPEYLYEYVALLTKDAPSEAEITRWLLSLRYYHKADLPSVLSFSTLVLCCNNLNYQKELNFATIEQVFKQLLLQADFHSMLLTFAKLLPLLTWAQGRPLREIEDALGPAFREFTRPVASSQLTKAVSHQEAKKCFNQHLSLLKLLDSKNLFLFFFNLINGTNDSLENDIDIYFIELATTEIEREGLISTSELTILQKNIELEYGKLRKRKYQEEVIEATYKWLEAELEAMHSEAESHSAHLFSQLFAQVVRTHSNIGGATLLQVLDASAEGMEPAKVVHFLELVDCCIIQGSYKISTQTILFLVCTIFTKIHSKKLSISGEVILDHFLLWKEVAIRKQLPVKLIICLIEWLPFLYDKPLPKSQNEPEILQLYRQQILKLENGWQSSEISNLRVLIEELEYRKMERIYGQLQEFHSQMDRPDPKKSTLSRPSNMTQLNFHFKISGLSKSNSEINSLLDGLESVEPKLKSNHMHLELLSKSQQSGSLRSGGNSERSFKECVEIIMSLIDLFDYHVREPSIANQTYTTTKKQSLAGLDSFLESNFLPVVSTHHALPSSESSKTVKVAFQPIRNLDMNVVVSSEQMKKRMVKRRGLVVKNECLQIGYQFDNQTCKITFFITFLRPVTTCRLRLRENTFKFKGQKDHLFTEPKLNAQYQLNNQIHNVKLYSLQGVPNSERVVRSRLELKLLENRKESEEIYDVPLAIYNLIEWLPVSPQDLPRFEEQPSLETRWYPACPRLINHGQQYLRKFAQFVRDSKGCYLMKCRMLGEEVLARVVVVVGEAKVQVLAGSGALVAMGLLEVIV